MWCSWQFFQYSGSDFSYVYGQDQNHDGGPRPLNSYSNSFSVYNLRKFRSNTKIYFQSTGILKHNCGNGRAWWQKIYSVETMLQDSTHSTLVWFLPQKCANSIACGQGQNYALASGVTWPHRIEKITIVALILVLFSTSDLINIAIVAK